MGLQWLRVEKHTECSQRCQINAGPRCVRELPTGLFVQHPTWQNTVTAVRQYDRYGPETRLGEASHHPHVLAVQRVIPIPHPRGRRCMGSV